MKSYLVTLYWLTICCAAYGQESRKLYSLTTTAGLTAVHVQVKPATYQGKKSVRVADTARVITPELKYAKLPEVTFHNGTIEVEVAGRPLDTAAETARGFVGIAFRINEDDTKFECLYLRPTNGRAEDQVRRNHSVQYISYPDFPWQKLRQDSPEKYESYVDLEVGKWTKVKIVVKNGTARLYVNEASQPCLLVSDLKHGATSRGAVGLWVGSGTEAYFRRLLITPAD
ncbi:hypothetical protein [Hymenobacter metallicola]|uniref:DUF1080 domain-containing protein n=1 Tax=Hymenobacter metallicola TaxID=2563114 RepID=A0A4Z0QD21_9BACT|nr:hypothetical protein [Hymenobacter metallicola]TGE27998.1 hypothetical protein E5K02_00605 [Hymenobacter metallicola]